MEEEEEALAQMKTIFHKWPIFMIGPKKYVFGYPPNR